MKNQLNIDKTVVVIFTERRPHVTGCLKINNQVIKWSEDIKYLGLCLGNSVFLTKYIKNSYFKVIRSLVKYYRLLNRKSSLSPNKKSFYIKVLLSLR